MFCENLFTLLVRVWEDTVQQNATISAINEFSPLPGPPSQCSIVSILLIKRNYTVLRGCHANKSRFLSDRLCWLVGWLGADLKAGNQAVWRGRAVSYTLLRHVWLKLSHHRGGVLTNTFGGGRNRWASSPSSCRHCGLQNNECIVRKSRTENLAAGRLRTSQKEQSLFSQNIS